MNIREFYFDSMKPGSATGAHIQICERDHLISTPRRPLPTTGLAPDRFGRSLSCCSVASSLTHENLPAYGRFLADPQPATAGLAAARAAAGSIDWCSSRMWAFFTNPSQPP